jgi:hypothetical protein
VQQGVRARPPAPPPAGRFCPLRNTHPSAACATAHLAVEAQLTHEEALLVLKLAAPHRVQPGGGGPTASHAVSARQIFEREAAAKRILTFAADLDGILGGGVETGAITEFWWVLFALPACGGPACLEQSQLCSGNFAMPACLWTQPPPNINTNSSCSQARHLPAMPSAAATATLLQRGARGGQDSAGHAAGA